ncbi:sugar ABC transporter permease [Gottschalkiaceae bacterium SANA]|nr:sugar ABC transporter permease [Gottschalkiaceae bacterium SANA]
MRKKNKWISIFLLPGVSIFIFVFMLSILMLVGTSFANWTIGSKITFAGFSNYSTLFTEDPAFIKSMMNTGIWIALQATIHIAIGVLLALLLAKQKWYTSFVRTAFFIPNIISSAALGMLFLSILNPQFGLVNNVMTKLLGEPFVQNWFMDPKTSFFSVTMTWLPYAGLVTILVMAEMASIPKEVYEAASIDGATSMQTDLFVVLPMMKNIIGTATILAATSMLQKLDIIMMTTGGGPGVRTMNMPMYLYRTALTDNNYGLANAQGVILIFLGLLTLITIRKIFKMDQED